MGGAVFSEGTLTLTDCTLSDNTAFGYPYHYEDEDPSYGQGGAIFISGTTLSRWWSSRALTLLAVLTANWSAGTP